MSSLEELEKTIENQNIIINKMKEKLKEHCCCSPDLPEGAKLHKVQCVFCDELDEIRDLKASLKVKQLKRFSKTESTNDKELIDSLSRAVFENSVEVSKLKMRMNQFEANSLHEMRHDGNIKFQTKNSSVELRSDGSFLVNNKKVETDFELYKGFKKLILPIEN